MIKHGEDTSEIESIIRDRGRLDVIQSAVEVRVWV